MSHIYEALQRAEAERTSAAHEDDVRVDPESLNMASHGSAMGVSS